MLTTKKNLMLLLAMGLAIGCGTDSGSGGNPSASGPVSSMTQGVTVSSSDSSAVSSSSPRLTLRVTDAAIDDAVALVLRISDIEFRKTSGGWIRFSLPTSQPFNLLQLQGTRTADVLQNVPIDADDYDEIRLVLDGTPMANYIDLGPGGMRDLFVPSGSSSGLKIKGDFTVSATGTTDLIADFDLRQSVRVNGGGRYRMDPVVRLVEADSVGHIRGIVSDALLSAPSCSDTNADTYNAVYVFAGHNATPHDINDNGDPLPVATASIAWDADEAAYLYEVAYLPAGDYTVTMTCNADLEDLDDDDDLRFFGTMNATVVVNNLVFL